MWKYITRGLRAPFERGQWTNLTSTAATDQGNVVKEKKSQLPCPFRFVPCFIELCQRHISQFAVQSNFSADHKNDSHNKSSDKTNKGDSFRSDHIEPPCCILEAFGWSGVLVLGWTILQPWYRHENRRKPLNETDINPDAIKRYSSLCKLLLHPAFSQPFNNHVLPPHVGAISNDKQLQASSTPPTSQSLSSTPTETESKTIEEAFEEATQEMRRVHELAIGEAENRLGIACISHKKNNEAVEHFKNALTRNHAPAAFNLGQCHELGIGTKQDFVKAAEFYKIASDMGHPSATYNLGVFYAHGWGGLTADFRKAKSLFLTAAALGQRDAQLALNMETQSPPDLNKCEKRNTDSFGSRLALDVFKMSNISLRFVKKDVEVNNVEKENYMTMRYRKPESSLPSSSASSSSLSTSSPSSLSYLNDYPLFNQSISAVEESSEDYSDLSSEDEWQTAIDMAGMNGNSTTLYRLAVCYENNPKADQELILQLYRMAADHGHQQAKLRLKILEDHYALGTLNEFLKKNK